MSWRDLLQTGDDRVVLPWTGGRRLPSPTTEYLVESRLPREHGWNEFRVVARKATLVGPAAASPGSLASRVTGYLVGDRIVADGARVDPAVEAVLSSSETVFLIDPGLARFARVAAGRVRPGAPLVFVQEEMPLGPESDVLAAFQDRASSVSGIKGVTPALDASFRLETWQRSEADRRRAEVVATRAAELARLAEEERKAELLERLSDGAGRRQMAAVDFGQAANAALSVTGAEYLDHRASANRGEMVVTFRLDGQRFECVADARTLRIIDSGICLVDHRTGDRGDTRFTLESLPDVIRQAVAERRLHVFRHVGQDSGYNGPWDGDDEENDDDW